MIIDLEPTDDQRMIAESIGGFLADRLPVSRLREDAAACGRAEAAAWSDLAGLGLFGLGLDEDAGGFGFGLPGEVLAARALGLHLASPSVLAQIAAAHLTTGAQRAAFAGGEAKAALAARGPDGACWLYDGRDASHVVVLGRGAQLLGIDEFGGWHEEAGLDETIALARSVAAIPDVSRDAAAERISLLLAAALTGVAQGATDMAVSYAAQREQFGQPIGSFQAIKHMCADMAVRAAAADSQTRVAAVMFGRSAADTREVAAARWLAGNAALENARANIQVHGGMGFTAECDAHIFLKRAHLLTALGSSRLAEEQRLMADVA